MAEVIKIDKDGFIEYIWKEDLDLDSKARLAIVTIGIILGVILIILVR